MRRAAVIAVAILLALLPAVRAVDDPRDPGRLGNIIRVLPAPQLAPGDSGVFRFNFTNSYQHEMRNSSLNVSIYQYATIEETLPVDANWRWEFPKIRESNGREYGILGPTDVLAPGTSRALNFTILTSTDMPHGSVFAQAAYFLRFWLEFDIDNGTGEKHYVMASKGYFTQNQWDEARTIFDPRECTPYNETNRCLGNLNLTRLGVDGVLPDSAFGVKEPIPIWPFYALIAATGFFLVLAFLFWVEENPGQYPRIERRWLVFKGRLRRRVRIPRKRDI